MPSYMMLCTAVFAYFDGLQEIDRWDVGGVCFGLAILANLPGVVAVWLFRREPKQRRLPINLVATVLCFFGMSVYIAYFLFGNSTSPNNVSQLHIFLFPILYFGFSLIVTFVVVCIALSNDCGKDSSR